MASPIPSPRTGTKTNIELFLIRTFWFENLFVYCNSSVLVFVYPSLLLYFYICSMITLFLRWVCDDVSLLRSRSVPVDSGSEVIRP